MDDPVKFRISINLSYESYSYLIKISRTKKRQTIIEEALSLHQNESRDNKILEDIKNEIKYITLDLEGKQALIRALRNSPGSEGIQIRIVDNFLENVLNKLNEILTRKSG